MYSGENGKYGEQKKIFRMDSFEGIEDIRFLNSEGIIQYINAHATGSRDGFNNYFPRHKRAAAPTTPAIFHPGKKLEPANEPGIPR